MTMLEHPDDVTLDAFVEGQLSADARAAVEAHVAACARCSEEVAHQRALLGALRALPASVDPGVDLRDEVRAAIRERADADARRQWLRSLRVPLAAAAVLLVALTAGVTALVLSERAPRVVLAPPPARDVTLASFDDSRAEYVRTAEDLALLLEHRRHELAPETIALVEENLRTIDRALAEAEAALRADSASPAVRALILATHEQKVDVLRWANALTRS